MIDHIHMVLRVPPKYSVAKAIRCLKVKSVYESIEFYPERRTLFGQSNSRTVHTLAATMLSYGCEIIGC